MRKVFTLLLSVGLVFGLTACANEPLTGTFDAIPSDYELPAGITVEFWHSMSRANGDAVQYLVDRFNAENEYGIFVNATYQGSYGDAHQKVTAALVAGEGFPDIGQSYGNNVATYFPSGQVVELDQFIFDPTFGTRDFEDILLGYRNESSAFEDGKYYTLPFSKSTEVLYYNADFFNKTGAYANREGGVFTPPTTWDELVVTAKAITAITGEPAFGYDSLANLFITWTQQNGGAYTQQEGTSVIDRALFNNDEAVSAVEFFATGVREGYFRVAGDDRYHSGPFTSGRVMMYIGSTSGSVFNENDLFTWSSAQVPMGDNRRVIQQGANFFMLNNGLDQAIAAFLFVDFVMETENTVEWSMRSGYLPVRESARDLPVYRDFLASNVNPTKETGASYLATDYIYDAIFPESFSVRQAVDRAIVETVAGLKPARTAIQDAYDSLQ